MIILSMKNWQFVSMSFGKRPSFYSFTTRQLALFPHLQCYWTLPSDPHHSLSLFKLNCPYTAFLGSTGDLDQIWMAISHHVRYMSAKEKVGMWEIKASRKPRDGFRDIILHLASSRYTPLVLRSAHHHWFYTGIPKNGTLFYSVPFWRAETCDPRCKSS